MCKIFSRSLKTVFKVRCVEQLYKTTVDVFFYVLEGKGVVEIGGEKQEVSKDTLIESPAKIPHRLLNPGDGIFRVLVVKVPRQTESTRLL